MSSSSGSEKHENIVRRLLRFHRRRLTIVSDDPLVDGFNPVGGKFKDHEDGVFEHPKPQKGLSQRIERCPSTVSDGFTVASFSCRSVKGKAPYNFRKQNQDTYITAQDPRTSTIFIAVLDGHGEEGHKISNTFRRELVSKIFSHNAWPTDVRKAVGESVESIEQDLLNDRNIETDFSGTTLVAVIIQGTHATVANIGDSRIILGKRTDDKKINLIAEELSFDHKPDVPHERERIVNAGGRVFAMEYNDGLTGPQRVWLGHRDLPGLAMSRSICDSVAHTVGVISEPSWYEYDLNATPDGNDCFIILASDGLWEFMSSEECVALASIYSKPKDAVNALIQESTARWLSEDQVVDDTTVVIGFLGDWKKRNDDAS